MADQQFTVIPTSYHHHLFRSRLEARWAVYFDALGIRWQYEPEGYRFQDGTCYLVDFWLPQVKMFAEVKPNDDLTRVVLNPEAEYKAAELALALRLPVIICDGLPRPTNYWAIWPMTDDPPFAPGWEWIDVYLDTEYLHEQRFYMSCGGQDFPWHEEPENTWRSPELISACLKAASWRF